MKHTYLFLAIILFCLACKPLQLPTEPSVPGVENYAEFILPAALMDCFPEGTKFDDGRIYNCEYSAAAMYEGSILLGNDKNTSAVSPMMLANGESLKKGTMDHPFELKQEEFFKIRKIEDFAFTPDKKTLFISSGFDRLKDNSSEWDLYNCLLAWNIKDDEFQMVSKTDNHGIVSSKELRLKFQKLLKSQHVKVEGLMVLPGNRLVFGIREKGEHYENPIYTSTFIECTYKELRGEILIDSPFEISYVMNTFEAKEDLGLSSLYFDGATNMIYFTTSFEEGEEGNKMLGGYIWSLSLADYEAGKAAQLMKQKNGQHFYLSHKVEAITKMDDGNFILIYDNDRTDVIVKAPKTDGVSRQNHECVYSIVKFYP